MILRELCFIYPNKFIHIYENNYKKEKCLQKHCCSNFHTFYIIEYNLYGTYNFENEKLNINNYVQISLKHLYT
ncbi:hypothetical protein PFNF135_04809 [Plasmodium falciparum NF135/5.C10]|uniref:Uncharacterized protein n=3 Tax=Plasmodium falciparum TaxID=5833 RepID=A0A024WLB8_PLAFA|nr:hypothetical protein PFFVO_04246 [Plasmodium falciparum Vietnam Oak-Knoll (FVO)]ETW40506.1 hypothetical protein PFNF135_04809 [Plasmodium falciparum NF135/5.C10]ETW47475.1 hypothetical protein PFMALIP_04487 [Plasmodium falciparum MaliPS096_E11]